jgi:hypothetical protein
MRKLFACEKMARGFGIGRLASRRLFVCKRLRLNVAVRAERLPANSVCGLKMPHQAPTNRQSDRRGPKHIRGSAHRLCAEKGATGPCLSIAKTIIGAHRRVSVAARSTKGHVRFPTPPSPSRSSRRAELPDPAYFWGPVFVFPCQSTRATISDSRYQVTGPMGIRHRIALIRYSFIPASYCVGG